MPVFVSHNNPLAPQTAASADDLNNGYQSHAQMLRGEAQYPISGSDGYNPYKPVSEPSQEDAQKEHLANMAQFLSPIGVNQYDVNTEHTPEQMKAFSQNLENDPVWKDKGDEMIEVLEPLRQGIISGQIAPEQAKAIAAQWAQEHLEPALEKHHGKHSDSHKRSLHDVEWIGGNQ